jgi:hypothetical protein
MQKHHFVLVYYHFVQAYHHFVHVYHHFLKVYHHFVKVYHHFFQVHPYYSVRLYLLVASRILPSFISRIQQRSKHSDDLNERLHSFHCQWTLILNHQSYMLFLLQLTFAKVSVCELAFANQSLRSNLELSV